MTMGYQRKHSWEGQEAGPPELLRDVAWTPGKIQKCPCGAWRQETGVTVKTGRGQYRFAAQGRREWSSVLPICSRGI